MKTKQQKKYSQRKERFDDEQIQQRANRWFATQESFY